MAFLEVLKIFFNYLTILVLLKKFSALLQQLSASNMIYEVVSMTFTGNNPIEVSVDSITASVPSSTAFATSLTSALVGRGLLTILSIIYVAVITGLPTCGNQAMKLKYDFIIPKKNLSAFFLLPLSIDLSSTFEQRILSKQVSPSLNHLYQSNSITINLIKIDFSLYLLFTLQP